LEDNGIHSLQYHRIENLGRSINPYSDFKSYKEFKKLVAQIKPDVIHTHTFKAGLIGRIRKKALQKAANKDIKFVHTFHGHLLDDPEFTGIKKRLIIQFEKYLADSTDKIITVGEKVATELINNGIGRSEIYANIPPGVNALPSINKNTARKNLDLSNIGIVIGWLARVTGVKNPILASEVANNLPDVQFIFGGAGDLLDRLYKSVDKNSNVYGWVDSANFISACDIILSTSENEGMPISLIESQMAGIPVVATDVGSVSEVIQDGVTGFLTSNSKTDIVSKLQKLIDDPELLRNMGQNARISAVQQFSPEAMISKHLDLYKNL
jgi:glycosyltransferase involved in cell wall biosynthesis